MSPLGVVLDVQHAGRASRPKDRGAAYDLDGDGVLEDVEHEVTLVAHYVASAAADLRLFGADVLVLDAGEYAERHARACAWVREREFTRAAYVACHVNAGRGMYGLVVHDHRSRAGKLLATCVAQDLGPFRPPLTDVHVAPTGPAGVDVAPDVPGLQESNYPRAWTCLHGVGDKGSPGALCGIVYEPGFLDQPQHADLWTSLGRDHLGKCLAHGVFRYLTQPVSR